MPWGRAFVIFFLPGGGALPRFSCPTPENFQLKEKKSANARGLPGGGWAMLELTDALSVRLILLSSDLLCSSSCMHYAVS